MKLTKCPLCGSEEMGIRTGLYEIEVGGKRISIPHVRRQVCRSCKEEFFDHESNSVLDTYRQTNSRHRAAA